MIDWNNSGIRIDGSQVFSISRTQGLRAVRNNNQFQRNDYESGVSDILDLINSRRAGNILLDEIRRALIANTRHIDVIPFDSSNNAASGGNMIRATPFGEIVRDERGNPRRHAGDNPATPQVERRGDIVVGTGEGISPTLLFDPRTFSPHLSATVGLCGR